MKTQRKLSLLFIPWEIALGVYSIGFAAWLMLIAYRVVAWNPYPDALFPFELAFFTFMGICAISVSLHRIVNAK